MARGLFWGLLLLLASCTAVRRELPETPTPQFRGWYKLGEPYRIGDRWYYPEYDPDYDRIGLASWYGPEFHGRITANGELFDRRRISAAHPTLPLPSLVEITNLENGRKLVVRVNDRGPFIGERLIDLSEAAAAELGFRDRGLARVRVRFLKLAEDALGTPPQPTRRAAARALQAVATRDMAKTACGDGTEGYLVQVAAVGDPNRARQLAERLTGLAPVRLEPAKRASARLVRIQLGPVFDAAVARHLLERARGLGYRGAFLAAAPAEACATAFVERG